jgi:excinuclease ABC subunit C
MVAFDEGEPDKSRYRRYRLRSVEGQDDFASLHEALRRRYERALRENDLPDLVVIDGGKGQLGVARAVFRELGLEQLEVVALAKERVARDARSPEIRRSEDRVFLPDRKNPLRLPQNSTALFLLQRVRDEAHRFAIAYHREVRRRERMRSVLDDIVGIGRERRRRLLRRFGSVRGIAAATVEEIAEAARIGPALAAEVLEKARRAQAPAPRAPGKLVLQPLEPTSNGEPPSPQAPGEASGPKATA